MSDHTVHVDNGKYTFIRKISAVASMATDIRNGLVIKIKRHGEEWHVQHEAFNAIASIMAELDAARVVVDACRSEGDDAPRAIKHALATHAALVSDLEAPSDWTR